MCGDDNTPSPEGYRRNMGQPMPLGRKIRLTARNLSRRLFPKPATCCGNHGEPGC